MEPHAPSPAQRHVGWGPAVATAQLQMAVPRAPTGFCFCFVSLPPRNTCADVRVLTPGVNVQNCLSVAVPAVRREGWLTCCLRPFIRSSHGTWLGPIEQRVPDCWPPQVYCDLLQSYLTQSPLR